MVALALLFIGGIATAQLVNVLGKSSTKVDAATDAIALANVVIAQINDAAFYPTVQDPGLSIGVHNGPNPPASTIQAIGLVPPVNPQFRVSYEVIACTRCRDPYANGSVSLDGIEIIVTVDNATNQIRKLRSPMRFFVRKELAPSNTDPAFLRGW
jgi:hypothetical protein